MSGILVALDLRKFTAADAAKIGALRDKIVKLHRWCRCERVAKDGLEYYALYSGGQGNQPYASYRLYRDADGRYLLRDGRTRDLLATGRTIDDVIDALPDNFYYNRY